jgi:hypothetical protein
MVQQFPPYYNNFFFNNNLTSLNLNDTIKRIKERKEMEEKRRENNNLCFSNCNKTCSLISSSPLSMKVMKEENKNFQKNNCHINCLRKNNCLQKMLAMA